MCSVQEIQIKLMAGQGASYHDTVGARHNRGDVYVLYLSLYLTSPEYLLRTTLLVPQLCSS